MRLIPGKTKVKIELFKGVQLGDVVVSAIFGSLAALMFLSTLPYRIYICIGLIFVAAALLFRLDEEPNYSYLLRILRHLFSRRLYVKIYDDKAILGMKDGELKREYLESYGEESTGEEDTGFLDEDLEEEEELAEDLEDALRSAGELSEEQPEDPAAEENDLTQAEPPAEEESAAQTPVEEWVPEEVPLPKDILEELETPAQRAKREKQEKKEQARKEKQERKEQARKERQERKEQARKERLEKAGKTAQPSSEKDRQHYMRRARWKAAKARKQAEKELLREENRILKSKEATKEEKDAVWLARAERSAEKKRRKNEETENAAAGSFMDQIMAFTDIHDDMIDYDGKYYGAAIEIDPVEFRFFSKFRRNNSIETGLGRVLRAIHPGFYANIVKLERPVHYERYLDLEYDKLDELRESYENGVLSEEELKARVEVQYDRINELRELCGERKVISPFYYLVLFESDIRQLENQVRSAMDYLRNGDLTVRRLDTKELAVFLKYSNQLDFDESGIDRIDPEQYALWAMPETVKMKMRTVEVNHIVTHNFCVTGYPTLVGDAYLAGVMSVPATKVVVKCTPMERDKAIRAIDHSLTELRDQYSKTGVDSKKLELANHVDTLQELLTTLQGDNEVLLEVSIYITAYDIVRTEEENTGAEPNKSALARITEMKKTLKRVYSEAGFRLSGMDFGQREAFVGSQVSAYDPLQKEARGIPSNSLAAAYPWIYAHISDVGGVKLGSEDGVPVFIDFFRRDSERVNSNMVIIGKSGSGKSYATKSLLTNLASDNCKIFILDPENEYTQLAHNLHGKIINVGNAQYGRLNPFHIITALEDDEAGGDSPSGTFATHLQFLEEFFRQILPDCDRDAMEYLNSLMERVYADKGILPDTDLSGFGPEDYPVFDDLYDAILLEFQKTDNEYLRSMLRILTNYIAKFSAGGRNSNIWNGPSTVTTDENFTVFNFQSILANRNGAIANAQMLLVLKYIDNEIIKNRDYNLKYGLNRKIVVVIDEAHVFIDTKFPVALDFMFQLAKRIRKYNGMQIVITQNIKDFVGNEEIARKSTAIINASQYSFIFALAPNDIRDLVTLYEMAGGINEQEQEQITTAPRGQAFTIMSPTSRSTFKVEVPSTMVEMFELSEYESHYFANEGEIEGVDEVWEDFVAESREAHERALSETARRNKDREAKEASARENSLSVIFEEYAPGEEEIDPDELLDRIEAQHPIGAESETEETSEETSGIVFEEITEEELAALREEQAAEEAAKEAAKAAEEAEKQEAEEAAKKAAEAGEASEEAPEGSEEEAEEAELLYTDETDGEDAEKDAGASSTAVKGPGKAQVSDSVAAEIPGAPFIAAAGPGTSGGLAAAGPGSAPSGIPGIPASPKLQFDSIPLGQQFTADVGSTFTQILAGMLEQMNQNSLRQAEALENMAKRMTEDAIAKAVSEELNKRFGTGTIPVPAPEGEAEAKAFEEMEQAAAAASAEYGEAIPEKEEEASSREYTPEEQEAANEAFHTAFSSFLDSFGEAPENEAPSVSAFSFTLDQGAEAEGSGSEESEEESSLPIFDIMSLVNKDLGIETMNPIEEMLESGEDVAEVSLEELAEYLKLRREKKKKEMMR